MASFEMSHPALGTTDGVAFGAVASPVFLPWLDNISAFAASILPILGAVWLSVRIAAFIYTFFKAK